MNLKDLRESIMNEASKYTKAENTAEEFRTEFEKEFKSKLTQYIKDGYIATLTDEQIRILVKVASSSFYIVQSQINRTNDRIMSRMLSDISYQANKVKESLSDQDKSEAVFNALHDIQKFVWNIKSAAK